MSAERSAAQPLDRALERLRSGAMLSQTYSGPKGYVALYQEHCQALLDKIEQLGDEIERRAAENARLQDGVIQMVDALWAIYGQAQSVARKPSPV